MFSSLFPIFSVVNYLLKAVCANIESFLAGYPYQMMAFAENQSINSTVDGRVKEVMVDSRINKVISRMIFLE